MTTHFSRLLLMLIPSLGACSEGAELGPPPPASSGAGTNTTPNQDESLGGAGNGTREYPDECGEIVPLPHSAHDIFVEQIALRVLDQYGVPASDLLTQVCGFDVCYSVRTDEEGTATLSPNGSIDSPALKVGDGTLFERVAVGIAASEVESFFEWSTVRLPSQGSELKSGTTPTSGGVKLTIPESAALGFDLNIYDNKEARGFRAARIPKEALSLFTRSDEFIDGYALGPSETWICPGAKLTLPNNEHLVRGTALDVFLNGTATTQDFVPYGSWTKIADAFVSDDEETIETSSDALPILGAIALKVRDTGK